MDIKPSVIFGQIGCHYLCIWTDTNSLLLGVKSETESYLDQQGWKYWPASLWEMVAARIKTSVCSGRRVDEHLKPAVISVFSLTSLTVWSSDRPSRNTLLKPLCSAHRWFCEEFNWGPLLSNNRVQVGQTEVITDPMLALDAHTTLPEWHFSNVFWSSACIEKDELKLGSLGLHKPSVMSS